MVLLPEVSEFLLCNPMMELRLETRKRIGDLHSDGFDLAIRFGEPSRLGAGLPSSSRRTHPDRCLTGLYRPTASRSTRAISRGRLTNASAP